MTFMLIRPAQVSVAAAIAKVHVDSWRTTYRGMVPDSYLQALSYEQRTRRWQDALSDSDNQRFVYVAENEVGKVIIKKTRIK